MKRDDLPGEFLEYLEGITGKRARVVIDHILEHGYITTEELSTRYGYNHPPRAARDVREQGVPLEIFWMESSDGRKIGAYRFGNPDEVSRDKLGGRTVIPRSFKRRLLERHHGECCICLEQYDSRHLQVDHRVPYEVAGDLEGQRRKVGDYMLLCGSCNRAKSWSCEQCKNWNALKSAGICQRCYWAYPEHYDHVAMRNIRRLDIVWTEEEADKFDEVKRDVEANGQSIQDYVKLLLLRHRHDD